MKRVPILGAMVWLIGCGNGGDRPDPLVQSNNEGGKSATGGRKSVAGAAGRAGSSGSAGRSGSTAIGGGGGAGRAGSASSSVTNAGASNGGSALNLAGASGQVVRPVAPIVIITSPVEVTDPNAPGVIGGDSVDVTCSIAKGSAEGATVDPESLKIQLMQKGVTYDPTTNNLPFGNSRKQSFALTVLESGPAAIVCTGNDKSNEPITSIAQINTLIDRGPEVVIIEPKDRAPWNASKPLVVRFTVTPKELTSLTSIPDTKAATSKVEVLVNSTKFTATPSTNPNEYVTREIRLDSRTDFDTGDLPANLTPIQVSATNQRGKEALASLRINVDSTPPVISIKSPDPTKAAVIGGTSQLVFEVTDPAVGGDAGTGVNLATVKVYINNKKDKDDENNTYGEKPSITRWGHVTDGAIERFTFNFDVKDFAGSGNQVTVQVVASDYANNETPSGNTASYFVDTTPPLVDLDPPTVRELIKDGGNILETSAFDPLGDAVNDLEVIGGDNFFRVLAWEQANYSEAIEYIAGIGSLQTASTDAPVQLWLQTDVNEPLLVDTDGDKFCDDINRTATPAPIPKNLVPITPAGTSPRFTRGDPYADDLRYWPWPPLLAGYPHASPAKLPDFLCSGNSSSFTRVIKHNVVSSSPVPVVYGLEPAADMTCTGNFWGIVASVTAVRGKADGWICAAARAKDNVGNIGVSPVIRLCLDSIEPGVPTCATNLQPAPSPANIPEWVIAKYGLDSKKLAPPKSAEPFTCKLDCTMRTQSPVRYVTAF